MKNVNIENEEFSEALSEMRNGEQGNIVNNGMHFMKIPEGVLYYNEYYGITFVPKTEEKEEVRRGRPPKLEDKIEKPMNEKRTMTK